MAINSIIQSGLQGVQQGLASAEAAASRIAAPPSDQFVENLTEATVELLQAELQTRASARVLEAAGETLGTLVDTFA